VRVGAVYRKCRALEPVVWDALRGYQDYGDVELQQAIDLTKLRVVGSAVSVDDESSLDPRVVDYVAKKTLVDTVLHSAISFWSNQVIQQTARGNSEEVVTYPDRIRTAENAIVRYRGDLALQAGEVESLTGSTSAYDAPAIDDCGPLLTPGLDEYRALPVTTQTYWRRLALSAIVPRWATGRRASAWRRRRSPPSCRSSTTSTPASRASRRPGIRRPAALAGARHALPAHDARAPAQGLHLPRRARRRARHALGPLPAFYVMADRATARQEAGSEATSVHTVQLYVEGIVRSDAFNYEDRAERIFHEGAVDRRAKRTINAIIECVELDPTLGGAVLAAPRRLGRTDRPVHASRSGPQGQDQEAGLLGHTNRLDPGHLLRAS
jgi:hypothetical protein